MARTALTTVHLVLMAGIPVSVGSWILVHEGRVTPHAAVLATAAFVFLLIGYVVGRAFLPQAKGVAQLQFDPVRDTRYVAAITTVAGVFTLLHFVLGGIPILSTSPETSRFDFTNSGLLGIPGRMYLFGAPLAAGVALARSRKLGVRWYSDRLTVAAVSVLLVSRLLSGFKGGLLEVLIVLLIVAVLTEGPIRSVMRMTRSYSLLLLGAIIAVFLVGTLYGSYRSSGQSVTDVLLARATTTAAEPGMLVLERRLPEVGGSSLDIDSAYFAQKYLGLGDGRSYAFDRLVAATLLNVNPESDAYTASVTYGGYAELAFDFGSLAALAAMLCAGTILAMLEVFACRKSLGHYMVCLAGVLAMFYFVTKGGLIYTTINWAAVTAMLLLVGVAGGLVGSHRQASVLAGVER